MSLAIVSMLNFIIVFLTISSNAKPTIAENYEYIHSKFPSKLKIYLLEKTKECVLFKLMKKTYFIKCKLLENLIYALIIGLILDSKFSGDKEKLHKKIFRINRE